MSTAWDQRKPAEQRRLQNVLLRQSILQMALGHVPYVRNRLAAAGIDARLFKGRDELDRLPLSMRRDVLDPRRNPEGSRGVVLRGTAEGVKRFSDRSVLRRVALARLFGGEDVQERAIEAATRAIHVHLAEGPGGRIPVAYTRDDLDLLARAGGRLAQVVDLTREDRLLNLIPFGPTLSFWGIFYMAHGLGISAVHARRERADIASALDLFDETGATAIAVPSDEAVSFLEGAARADLRFDRLRTLLAVGRSLTSDERVEVGNGLLAVGAQDARLAAIYGPPEGRVLWGECSVPAGRTETFGFHTYPDMDVVEVVSPETGEALGAGTAGEIVVTPLGFRGGGVPRWRTGDLALGGMATEPCPNCGRTVPRVGPTVAKQVWTRTVSLAGKRRVIDLRAAGAAAAERSREWQVELDPLNGQHHLYVHLVAGPDPAPLIDLYEELARIGSPPTQVVLSDRASMRSRTEQAPGPWHRYWIRGESPFQVMPGQGPVGSPNGPDA